MLHIREVFLDAVSNFEVSECAAWAVRVTEIFLYIKAYSFGGNKENFELSGVSS